MACLCVKTPLLRAVRIGLLTTHTSVIVYIEIADKDCMLNTVLCLGYHENRGSDYLALSGSHVKLLQQ